MVLDIKDKKLLYEIDLNARLGTSSLGKRIGLSQEGVFYRLKRFERNNIISGYITLLNFGKLGYTGYGVYARFQNVNPEKKAKIIRELKKNKHIYWIAEYGGKYDLAFAIMAKNIIQFNEIFTKISSKYHHYLIDFNISIRVELVQYPRDYLLDKKNVMDKSPYFGKYIEEENIEDIDTNILKKISEFARLSVLEISNKIKNSPQTVTLHLKKLEKKGIIQGYSSKIHCQEFGYESYQLFVCANNITEKRKKELFSYCQNNPNIIFCIETVGKWNFEIIYEIEDQKKLQDLIIEFRSKFSDIITDIESIVLFNHYLKYNQFPF